jgi:hypothetical protein
VTQPPRLMRSSLTGRVYVITRYKVIDAERDLIQAQTKHDVTKDFERIACPPRSLWETAK